MRDETISKNYAETLFELALREESIEEYGAALATVARLLDEDARFLGFIETPRIDDIDRKAVVQKVFGTVLPRHVLNFVLVTVDKRRQRLLREISEQYNALVDERLNREHVSVTLARSVDKATEQVIADRLSDTLGKIAIPHFRVKPDIIGGLVVRTSDTIYDGSIRRRLDGMRRQLLRADLPTEVLGDAAK
ncbi:MAG: ATP synthase F1 subunit delta [Gemmatimonadota bacterium]|nr:ATP synthase F1 subunit delta [Gemmatimonadota bacterium]